MNEEFAQIVRQAGYDPAAVIDGSVEDRFEYMWQTNLPWPAGGTYVADSPSRGGKMVMARKISTIRLELLGDHPNAVRAYATAGSNPVSEVEFVVEGDWQKVE